MNPKDLTYRADETEGPAGGKTGAISASAKERKDWTTTGSNWAPLASLSRRTASRYGKPLRYGREETMASKASMTQTMRETTGISAPFSPAGYPLPSNDS